MTKTEALAQFDQAVYKYAHQWFRYPSVKAEYDLEDLAQIARIYVLLAIEEYQPDAGMKLSTYIIQRIRWGLNTTLRSVMPRAKRESVTFSIDNLNEEQGDRWHPCVEDGEDCFDDMIASLSPATQHIFRLRFAEDMTLAEIGKNVGKSNEWVRQFINKTLENMEA